MYKKVETCGHMYINHIILCYNDASQNYVFFFKFEFINFVYFFLKETTKMIASAKIFGAKFIKMGQKNSVDVKQFRDFFF